MSRNWLQFAQKGTPVVSVSIGPRRFYALIDTDAQISMVAPDVAIRLGLPNIGLQRMIGITGEVASVPAVQMPPVAFGNTALASCRAAVLDVRKLGSKIEIILGVNAFANRRLQFDFKDERIYILG
ncbi:MAG: Aspartyl protease [Blastocatellia bacterium]